MITLDLGCGPTPRGPSYAKRYGVDIAAFDDDSVQQANLVWEPIPFEDKSIDRIYAWDFLEHLPKVVWYKEGDEFKSRNVHVELFNEIYRVLVPGGIFESCTPHLPHFQPVHRDPTHVSVWVEEAWDYYLNMHPCMKWYGYKGDFTMEKKEWRGHNLYVELKKR